jgi:hypothetical protein
VISYIPAKATTENWQGEGLWTRGVKQALVDVGRRNGFLAGARDCEADHPEWLYDVFWFQLDQAKHLTDVPLVAECEWSGLHAIKYDFEKLLVARSKYRVMVFQADTDGHSLQLVRDMKLWIHKYFQTQSGDRYFFAGWARTHWVFEHYVVNFV